MKRMLGLVAQPAIVLWLFVTLLCCPAYAQNIQQDRRIEEEKRDALQPTVAAPVEPTAQPATRRRAAPPVPMPHEDIYLVNLVHKPIAFRYDAVKAIVILLGVDQEYLDLASQVAFLQERGILPKRHRQTFDPMEPLRRGLTAYMFRQALGVRGGIALHLFGPSERYALKELAFQGIMSSGHVNDLIEGAELVQVMSQAAQHQLFRHAGSWE